MSRDKVTLDEPEPVRGWGFPGNANKAHFFHQGRSLCLGWIFTGTLTHDDGRKGPDDCAKCRRMLDAEAKRAERAKGGDHG